MDAAETLILTGLIFLASLLYSASGQAGGSAYLAAMGFMGTPAAVMKPVSLVLNILVAGLATAGYHRAAYVPWRRMWPLFVTSLPMAFAGGALQLPEHVYKPAVGLILLLAAGRLVWGSGRSPAEEEPPPRLPVLPALLAGGVIGLVAGTAGIGGGIFLGPLLMVTGWTRAREAAGASAVFNLTNSAAGILGNVVSVKMLPAVLPLWAGAALLGALGGTRLGIRHLSPAGLRRALAAVLVISGARLLAG